MVYLKKCCVWSAPLGDGGLSGGVRALAAADPESKLLGNKYFCINIALAIKDQKYI